MIKTKWEFRVNGVRCSADVYSSRRAAIDAMFRQLNALHHAHPDDNAHNGRLEGELLAIKDRRGIGGRFPRLLLTARRNGEPWILEVARVPWVPQESVTRI